jgi:excinuclease ABC subunit C
VEAYDIAHHAGKEAVGVMVVREGGNFIREAYRTFLLKEARAGDDPSALREVVTRRLRHPEWRFPDLIVVDGAAAQVRVAEAAVAGAGLVIPVVGVVKDERHKPLRIIGKLPVWARDTEVLEANAEAHRFAIGRHRRRQRKVLA